MSPKFRKTAYDEGLDDTEPDMDYRYPDYRDSDVWLLELDGSLDWLDAVTAIEKAKREGQFRSVVSELVHNGKKWIIQVV